MRRKAERKKEFVPALGLRVLDPLYDRVVGLVMRERLFKGQLIEQMRVRPGQRILDVGCGTGTLALLIKQRHPDSEVVGLDPDSRILDIARRKAQQAGLRITFDNGYADQSHTPTRLSIASSRAWSSTT